MVTVRKIEELKKEMDQGRNEIRVEGGLARQLHKAKRKLKDRVTTLAIAAVLIVAILLVGRASVSSTGSSFLFVTIPVVACAGFLAAAIIAIFASFGPFLIISRGYDEIGYDPGFPHTIPQIILRKRESL